MGGGRGQPNAWVAVEQAHLVFDRAVECQCCSLRESEPERAGGRLRRTDETRRSWRLRDMDARERADRRQVVFLCASGALPSRRSQSVDSESWSSRAPAAGFATVDRLHLTATYSSLVPRLCAVKPTQTGPMAALHEAGAASRALYRSLLRTARRMPDDHRTAFVVHRVRYTLLHYTRFELRSLWNTQVSVDPSVHLQPGRQLMRLAARACGRRALGRSTAHPERAASCRSSPRASDRGNPPGAVSSVADLSRLVSLSTGPNSTRLALWRPQRKSMQYTCRARFTGTS